MRKRPSSRYRLDAAAIARAAAAPGPADAERRAADARARVAKIAALLGRVSDPTPLLAQLEIEQSAARAAEAEVSAARRAVAAPTTPPTRAEVRAGIGAFVEALPEIDPAAGNAILQRAIGRGGIVVSPSRLRWDCAGSIRLGPLLPNSGFGAIPFFRCLEG